MSTEKDQNKALNKTDVSSSNIVRFQIEENWGDGCKGFIYFTADKNTPIEELKVIAENEAEKEIHDNISRTQRELIQLQGNIDENQNNNRRLTPLQRRFSQKKTELDNLLKELYNLGEDDILIPKINESYGTD